MSKRITPAKDPVESPAPGTPAAGDLPPEDPKAGDLPPEEPTTEVTEVLVSAVHDDLRHLFTNAVFTKHPQKAQLDSFLQAQLDAGKLQLHVED